MHKILLPANGICAAPQWPIYQIYPLMFRWLYHVKWTWAHSPSAGFIPDLSSIPPMISTGCWQTHQHVCVTDSKKWHLYFLWNLFQKFLNIFFLHSSFSLLSSSSSLSFSLLVLSHPLFSLASVPPHLHFFSSFYPFPPSNSWMWGKIRKHESSSFLGGGGTQLSRLRLFVQPITTIVSKFFFFVTNIKLLENFLICKVIPLSYTNK